MQEVEKNLARKLPPALTPREMLEVLLAYG